MTASTTRSVSADRRQRLGLLNEPLGYVDGQNLYEYVGGDPVGVVDPDGTVKRNSAGQIVTEAGFIDPTDREKKVVTKPNIVTKEKDRNGQEVELEYKWVLITLDDGSRLSVTELIRGPEYFRSNCWGYALLDGKYWVGDPLSATNLINGEGFTQDVAQGKEQAGDLAIYLVTDQNGRVRPEHGAIVRIPGEGKPPTVEGKDGSADVARTSIVDQPFQRPADTRVKILVRRRQKPQPK